MRKNVFGRKFKRDANERKALFRGLIRSLILHDRIQTTLEKAKAIKGDVDKIINKAKKGERLARYFLQPILSEDLVNKIINDLVPRLSDRNSGYTKLTHLGRRFSDNASMVLMEWTAGKFQKPESGKEIQEEKTPKTQRKTDTLKRKKDVKK